jgi:hypothetical protein
MRILSTIFVVSLMLSMTLTIPGCSGSPQSEVQDDGVGSGVTLKAKGKGKTGQEKNVNVPPGAL